MQRGQAIDVVDELTRRGQELLREDLVGGLDVAFLLGLEDAVAGAQIVRPRLADSLPQRLFLVGLDQGLDLLLQGRRVAGRGRRFLGEKARQTGVGALCDRGGPGDPGLDVARPVVDQALLGQ